MKKRIQAIFFDIDGTLATKEDKVPLTTIKALKELNKKGIKLFIATGRPAFVLESFKKQFDFEFDGWIIMNGQYCTIKENIIVREQFLKHENVKIALEYLYQKDVAAVVNTNKGSYLTKEDSYLMEANKTKGFEGEHMIFNMNDIENHHVIQITFRIEPHLNYVENTFLELLGDCKPMRWNSESMDIISSDGGKDEGIAAILDYFEIPKDNAIAFGDGENDIDMLKYVGIGIAMGNASEKVKQFADYITSSIDEDGIYDALKHFELIE